MGMERGWNKLCEWAGGKEEEGRGHTHMEGVMKVNELLQVMKVYQASRSG